MGLKKYFNFFKKSIDKQRFMWYNIIEIKKGLKGDLKKMANNFSIIGKIKKLKDGFTVRTDKNSTWETANLRFMVLSGTNAFFTEVSGFKWTDNDKNVIKTLSSAVGDGKPEPIEIKWNDRLSEDVVSKVASFKKYYVDVDGETHKYIHQHDFAMKAKELVEANPTGLYSVSGEISYEPYEGRVYRKLIVKSIRLLDEEKEEQSVISTNIYFTKDYIDKDEYRRAGVVTLNSFFEQYDKQAKKNVLYKVPISIRKDRNGDALIDKINRARPEDGKIYSLGVTIEMINGSEKREMTEDEIRADIMNDPDKAADIESGLSTLEDYLEDAKKSIYGPRKTDNVLINLNKTGRQNGVKVSKYIESDISTMSSDEQASTPKKSDTAKTSTQPATTAKTVKEEDPYDIFSDEEI